MIEVTKYCYCAFYIRFNIGEETKGEVMKRAIKGFQVFSFITLCCTIIMWIALWLSSAVPGTQSGAHTDKVTGIVDNAFAISDKVNETLTTYQIGIGIKESKSVYFIGDTAEAYVSYKPEATKDRDVIYSSSNTNIATIEENGIVTFKNSGTVAIYAKLKSNEKIYARIYLRSYGEDPLDPEHPERLSMSYVTSLGEAKTPVVGERRNLLLNNGKTDVSLAQVKIDDEDILFYWRGYLYGRKEGETNITLTIKDGDEEYKISETVKVEAGTLPTLNFKMKENASYIQGNYANKNNLLKIPNGNEEQYDCMVESSNSGVVSLSGPGTLYMNGMGKATLTYISCYDPTQRATVEVEVKLNPPKEITMTGPDSLVCHGSATYIVNLSPVNYSHDTTWTVVSGPGEITQNGSLTANGYGTIVIRCTSNFDEEIYVEKVVKVKLFQSAYGFVRKAMGHAGLSAVLGFGVLATLWLLLKRKYLIITSLPICYFYAYISEFIQKFTPGRYASWNDVFIDFAGTVVGMIVAIVMIVVISLLWRLINKKSFTKFMEARRVVNFRTLFTKTSKLEFVHENMHIIEPNDEFESETLKEEENTHEETITAELLSETPLADNVDDESDK